MKTIARAFGWGIAVCLPLQIFAQNNVSGPAPGIPAGAGWPAQNLAVLTNSHLTPVLRKVESTAKTMPKPPQAPGSKRSPRPETLPPPVPTPDPLKPGIYETHPYTSIVVVPRGHPDDKALTGKIGTAAENNMPVKVPELHFVPREKN